MNSKEFITTWDPPIMNKKEWHIYIKKERKIFLIFSLFLLLIGLIGFIINFFSAKDFYCYLLFSPFIIMPFFIIFILVELKIRKLQEKPTPSMILIENLKLNEMKKILEIFLSNNNYEIFFIENSKIKKSHSIEHRYSLNNEVFISILVSQYTKEKFICIGYTFKTYSYAIKIQDDFSEFLKMQ